MIVVDSIDAPSSNVTGITFVGKNLYSGDDGSLEITKLKTTGRNAGESKNWFSAPGEDCVGLTSDGDILYNADFNWSDGSVAYIHKIKFNGDHVNSFIAPGLCPEGLAFDGEFIWHTEWRDNIIYKLSVTSHVIISLVGATPCFGPERCLTSFLLPKTSERNSEVDPLIVSL